MTRTLAEEEKKEIYEHIRAFLSDELDTPVEEIGPDTKILDDLDGDSLIYLELVEDFKKKYDINVEMRVIGLYLQRNPIFTVGETARAVCDIIEQGDSLVAAEDLEGESDPQES
ncbi:MAG: acyl carrier protein [Planctomycetota bacterium]|jgi:acyl carrier protein